jgi:hypothetical protein
MVSDVDTSLMATLMGSDAPGADGAWLSETEGAAATARTEAL